MEINGYKITKINIDRYCYDNLALSFESNGELFAVLTTNLVPLMGENEAFVDTNNCSWAEEIIEKYKLGEFAGDCRQSGFCKYPLYTFDLERIERFNDEVR